MNQSMRQQPTRQWYHLAFALPALLAMSACALIRTPEPKTAIYLRALDTADLPAWPAQVELAAVHTHALLATRDLVVFDGAQPMRLDGLKWAEPPADMLREQIEAARAASADGALRVASELLSLDVRLQFHEIQVDADAPGQREAFVGVTLRLTCADRSHSVGPRMIQKYAPASGLSAAALAEAFNVAQTRIVQGIAAAATEMASACAASGTKPESASD